MATATKVFFPWRDTYSVAIPEIDNQHKGLIRLINDLQEAMMAGNGKTALSAVINDLIRYTESHFAYEEAMLRKQGYSGFAMHQQQHKELTRQVYELREKFQSGQLMMSVEVMQFLKNWLSDHILDRDQAYAKELHAKAKN
jgi:hemerythrin